MFASPFGNAADFERRSRRLFSHAKLASITALAGWKNSLPPLTYVTPSTSPSLSTEIEVTRAFGTTVRFFVACAAGIVLTSVELFAPLWQPIPEQNPQ